MERQQALVVLRGLLERANVGHVGTVSSVERDALQAVIQALGGEVSEPVRAKAPHTPPFTPPAIELVLDANERDTEQNPDTLLCLDFGTAMSKAFATCSDGSVFDLALGESAGAQGYPVPSSIFIDNDGKVYFGYEALEKSQALADMGRQRRDSIKSQLTLRVQGNLDEAPLPKEVNPTDVPLTEGDLIRALLAFLTDMAGMELERFKHGKRGVGRYVRRRFAHPCWPKAEQQQWADRLMHRWLAEAQILADTFSGKWDAGIDAAKLKAAVIAVTRLDKVPSYLVAEGVPEPVAVAASALADGDPKRIPFMVVDVGAGTTDFGLFAIRESPDDGISKIFQVPGTVRGLMQAGDKLDSHLLNLILDQERVERESPQGRLIASGLRLRIRNLKETLFDKGSVDYQLADGTLGTAQLDDFLASAGVKKLTAQIQREFKSALEAANESWLAWTAHTGLAVVLTGGGAALPMFQDLASGAIIVGEHSIARRKIDAMPGWIRGEMPDLMAVYPQLAVAIGGAAVELPESAYGPEVFGGGLRRPTYVASRTQVSGT